MSTVLILYASSHGQTKALAEHIAARFEDRGFGALLLDAKSHPRRMALPTDVDAVVVCARVHFRKHSRRLRNIVRENQAFLRSVPSLFVSVSATAARNDVLARREIAAHLDGFIESTGWAPSRAAAVAGAVLYTKYGPFLRWMIRRINAANGGPTDTSRDWVLTDWPALDELIADFATRVEPVQRRFEAEATA